MVDLKKPPLVNHNEHLHILNPSSRETASAVPVTRVRDLMAVHEEFIDERKISGRVLKFTPTATYHLEQALFLHKGAVMELPAGRACVVFQQTRYGVQARGFYALTDSRISGPAAYLDVEAPDVSAICLEKIEAGHTPLDGDFGGHVVVAVIAAVIYGCSMAYMFEVTESRSLALFLGGLMALTNGYLVAKYGASIWKSRGEHAKSLIQHSIETDVELFLPDVIAQATAPLEDGQ
ncbi:hypothetical protein AB9K35_18125 [Leisingera sp. XS_AS12]|uniref:hypothetical protein n=1 Tax=Leisingera sp. XS_AS12 TaxID=3241294 RepID=UPI0035198533